MDDQFWQTIAQGLLHPIAGLRFAVAEEDGAGVEAHGKIHELIAIGVGGEIKAIHLAMACEFTAAFAEVKSFTASGST